MLDHSLTYKEKKLKNVFHIIRLKKILKIIRKYSSSTSLKSFLDIGCSNGYITHLLATTYGLQPSKGVDNDLENLNIAKSRYKDIEFELIDLNKPPETTVNRFDLITCLETLEHVGNLNNAITSILNFAPKDKFLILISVPIEIGFWGIMKFLAKMVYGYKLQELPGNASASGYFKDLLMNRRISKYRDKRDGWGTHFGFDYRDIDEILNDKKIKYRAINHYTTRFYVITDQ